MFEHETHSTNGRQEIYLKTLGVKLKSQFTDFRWNIYLNMLGVKLEAHYADCRQDIHLTKVLVLPCERYTQLWLEMDVIALGVEHESQFGRCA